MRLWMAIGSVALGLVLGGPAIAEKPEWAGGGKRDRGGDSHDTREGRRDSERRQDDGGSFRFSTDMRVLIGDYYGGQARAGNCPPGLAKKKNGCLPPGQAKQWSRGRPLPADLRYHDLPRDLLRRLPAPPSGHRYVQIAGDVLLIAIGTSMVIDAVEDILR